MDDPSDIGRMSLRLSGNPAPDALREGSLAHWNFPKLGLWCREGAPAVMLSDGRGPSTNPKESQTSRHIGPTTRVMTKRLDEDWNTTTDGRETYLYMFQEVQNQA